MEKVGLSGFRLGVPPDRPAREEQAEGPEGRWGRRRGSGREVQEKVKIRQSEEEKRERGTEPPDQAGGKRWRHTVWTFLTTDMAPVNAPNAHLVMFPIKR